MATTLTLSPSARLLSYDPGGGHTDQLRDLSLAITLAELLGRSLVLPAYVYHRDVNVHTLRATVSKIMQKRPRLSSLIDVVNTSIETLDNVLLNVVVHERPRCIGNLSHISSTILPLAQQPANCVFWVEPPEGFRPVGATLRRYALLKDYQWLHFHSMLDVLSARKAKPKRFPLATWEQQLLPSACTIRYKPSVMAAALAALREAFSPTHPPSPLLTSSHVPQRQHHLAAHVRVLRRDRGKTECATEYLSRLEKLTSFVPGAALYICSDDLDAVLPRAAAALNRSSSSSLDGSGGGGVRLISARDAAPSMLAAVHEDAEMAQMALDVAAVLSASAFSPSRRSGLSVHLSAMRSCAQPRVEAPCDPALATCVPFASSGCGGRFDPALLHGPPPRNRKEGSAQWERKYVCPDGAIPDPKPVKCGT